jgi:hypothetical protein
MKRLIILSLGEQVYLNLMENIKIMKIEIVYKYF